MLQTFDNATTKNGNFFNKVSVFFRTLATKIIVKLKHKKMDTKKILIMAAVAAAVVLAMDFILPGKVMDDMTVTRFATKK